MGEIVSSTVVNEAVSRLSSLVWTNRSEQESVEERAERIEMAVLKIQAAVSISEDWHITKSPLLKWKAKLKRVANEGEDILQAYKKQALEDRQNEESAGIVSSSQRIARGAKRFAPFGRTPSNMSSTTVQRFERLANNADHYFKFVQSGGRPKSLVFLRTLNQSLLAGKTIEFSFRRQNGNAHVLLFPLLECQGDDGLEASLLVYYEKDKWERYSMLVSFRVSEAVDVVGIAMSCMEVLPYQFSDAIAASKQSLHEVLLAEDGGFPNPSATTACIGHAAIRNCISSHCAPSRSNGNTSGELRLPEPVVFCCARCVILPRDTSCSSSANIGRPVELRYAISPYVVPGKSLDHYEQVEPHTLGELLPKVTNGFYDEAAGGFEYSRELWCSGSSTYVSIAPLVSPPSTISQCKEKYFESSTAPQHTFEG